MKNETLTIQQAYLAMYDYLNIHLRRFEGENVGVIETVIAEMSLLQDGDPTDPAVWDDWLNSIEKAKKGEVDARLNFVGIRKK